MMTALSFGCEFISWLTLWIYTQSTYALFVFFLWLILCVWIDLCTTALAVMLSLPHPRPVNPGKDISI